MEIDKLHNELDDEVPKRLSNIEYKMSEQLERMESLESLLHEKEEEVVKLSNALAEWQSRCSELENMVGKQPMEQRSKMKEIMMASGVDDMIRAIEKEQDVKQIEAK